MWLICFAVFRVRECRLHPYILAIIVQSCLLFYSQLKDLLLLIINSSSCLKFPSTSFGKLKLKQKTSGFLIKIIFSSTVVNIFGSFIMLIQKIKYLYDFIFLVCINFFQLLFALTILEV